MDAAALNFDNSILGANQGIARNLSENTHVKVCVEERRSAELSCDGAGTCGPRQPLGLSRFPRTLETRIPQACGWKLPPRHCRNLSAWIRFEARGCARFCLCLPTPPPPKIPASLLLDEPHYHSAHCYPFFAQAGNQDGTLCSRFCFPKQKPGIGVGVHRCNTKHNEMLLTLDPWNGA